MERTEELTTLHRIEQKIDQIITRLDHLEGTSTHVATNCDRMNNHIEFVESVYSSCRHPLSWLLRKIGGLSGHQQQPQLPPPSHVSDTNPIREL